MNYLHILFSTLLICVSLYRSWVTWLDITHLYRAISRYLWSDIKNIKVWIWAKYQMYMLDRYLKLLEIGIWVKICAYLICTLAIYHKTMVFSVADRTNVFLKFSYGVFNFRSISVVDSISDMSKYNMMQF